jgi:hypothetical protein
MPSGRIVGRNQETMMRATLTGVFFLIAALGMSLPLIAQDNSALQRNLDRKVELSANRLPIAEVFKKLSASTGVEFVIDDTAYQSLPYGAQTRLTAQVADITLRNALTPILSPEALQWTVEGGAVRIMPSEPLYRMCRRATYAELNVLGCLLSPQVARITPSAKTDAAEQLADIVEQLRKITENKALDIKFVVPEDKRAGAIAHAQKSLPGNGAAFLDALTSTNDWTWYLDGDRVIVLDRRKQIERQLARQVTLKYENESIAIVLTDLAHKARVQLEIEPGVIQMLPADARNNFNLRMTDATIAEAMEVISGGTGLSFTRTAEGIRVEAGKRMIPDGNTPTRPRSSLVVRKTLTLKDGSTVDLIIRGEDMPDDLRSALEAEKAKAIEGMRAKFVKSTTQPTEH